MTQTATTLFMYQHAFHSNQSIKIGMPNESFANFSIVLSTQALHRAIERLIGRVENYTLHL